MNSGKKIMQSIVNEEKTVSEYIIMSMFYIKSFETANTSSTTDAGEKLTMILGPANNYFEKGLEISSKIESFYKQLQELEPDDIFLYNYADMINACKELLTVFDLKAHLEAFFSLVNTTHSYAKKIQRNGGYLTDKNRKDLGLYAQQLYTSILKITEELTNFKSYMLETKKKLEAMDSDTN